MITAESEFVELDQTMFKHFKAIAKKNKCRNMLINNYMDHLKIYDLDFFSNFSFTNRTLADIDISTIARSSKLCPIIMNHF